MDDLRTQMTEDEYVALGAGEILLAAVEGGEISLDPGTPRPPSDDDDALV